MTDDVDYFYLHLCNIGMLAISFGYIFYNKIIIINENENENEKENENDKNSLPPSYYTELLYVL
jgi:hypothetical protein